MTTKIANHHHDTDFGVNQEESRRETENYRDKKQSLPNIEFFYNLNLILPALLLFALFCSWKKIEHFEVPILFNLKMASKDKEKSKEICRGDEGNVRSRLRKRS